MRTFAFLDDFSTGLPRSALRFAIITFEYTFGAWSFNKSRSIRNSAQKKVGKRTLKQRIFIRSVVASQELRHFCPRPHRSLEWSNGH